MISPFVVAVALAAFPIMSLADKPNPADYPKPDTLAPANPAWLGTVLQGVPALPVGTKPLAAADWSKDVTVCPNANQWGLTYDDGPGPLTDSLLGELAKRNVKATFFVVGSRVMAYPDVLARTYQAGHQIGIHTWSHPYLSNTPSDQIVAEIVYTAKAIKQVIGVTPRFMRAPYGDVDERARAVLKNLGMVIVAWNVDPNDAGGATDVANQFKTKANAGSSGVISLEHDLVAGTVSQAAPALDAILAGSGGYKPMPVAVCLGQQAYDEGLWAKIGAAVPSGGITAGITNTTLPAGGLTNATLPAGGITNTTVLPGSSNSTSIALPTTNADKSAAATTSMAQSTNRPTSSPSVSVPPSALNAGKSAHSAMASLTITFAILGTLFAVSL